MRYTIHLRLTSNRRLRGISRASRPRRGHTRIRPLSSVTADFRQASISALQLEVEDEVHTLLVCTASLEWAELIERFLEDTFLRDDELEQSFTDMTHYEFLHRMVSSRKAVMTFPSITQIEVPLVTLSHYLRSTGARVLAGSFFVSATLHLMLHLVYGDSTRFLPFVRFSEMPDNLLTVKSTFLNRDKLSSDSRRHSPIFGVVDLAEQTWSNFKPSGFQRNFQFILCLDL
ncbi:hypothetical protein DFH06DRAFT_1151254 [Mycena polygramma]|nr:hypothetical protein DFH06DRAFT_1151254 [Mycena polygramma]